MRFYAASAESGLSAEKEKKHCVQSDEHVGDAALMDIF